MGDWPKHGGVTAGAPDDRSPAGYPTGWYLTLTANAAANTMGSYTELIASVPFDACGILLDVNLGAQSRGYLMDIAIGAAGSEVVVVPTFPWGTFRSTGNPDQTIFIPLKIRAGSRVAARIQSTTGASVLQVASCFLAESLSGIQPPSTWIAYGADTANSSGVAIATSGTPSAVQLTAATTASGRWAFICMLNGGADDYEWDFLVGAQSVIKNLRSSMSSNPNAILIPWAIPGGSQLQAKVKSVNSTTVRGMVLVGS
ncbi:MAG: hypothetical protein ACM35H_14205 [Bacteroidota bacterium]